MFPVSVQTFPPGTRPKYIHFVRHAHGKHNEVGEVEYTQYQREDLMDAELTEKGFQQCEEYRREAGKYSNSQLLVTSPMRRTIQTAVSSFPELMDKIPWIALECIREQTGFHPCDKRLPITHFQQNHPFIDFSNIENDEDPLYHLYEGREPDEDVERRARQFLDWLHTRNESEILVVTHSAFLRGLFQRVLFPGEPFKRFDNCETRSYVMYFPNSSSS